MKIENIISEQKGSFMSQKSIVLLGAAMGTCAGVTGCETAPHVMEKSMVNSSLQFDKIVEYAGSRNDVTQLRQYFTSLANLTYMAAQQDKLPIIVGGDHSIAIGSWSGISSALTCQNETLGIIWIDAHMDAHTPETSISGNIHGMPVATLLGYGYKELVSVLNSNPKIKPENIILIGIRSYENDEAKLLTKLGVKVYYDYDVDNQGFSNVFNESLECLGNNVDKIGLSVDLDGFDPEDFPGVGTPVSGGVHFNSFLDELNTLSLENIVAIEIAEFNPMLDDTNKTLNNVLHILDVLSLRVVEYNQNSMTTLKCN